MRNDLIIGMAGAGGDGVVSAGESLTSAAALAGYHAMMTKSFGSQIRGGESSCRVRIATCRVLSSGGVLDVAVALNWDDFLKFGAELPVGGSSVVLYDSKTGVAPDRLPLPGVTPAEVMAIPFTELARQAAGTDKAKNTLVLGLLSGWFGLARDHLLAGIQKRFAKKSADILEGNQRAFAAGLEYAATHPLRSASTMMPPETGERPQFLADGNDMCAAAAIFAGCEFFGGYPITPSSEIMQFLNRELPKYGGTVLQAEDEIAGIGAVVGASFAGKKAMTATSGPGMSLKTEMLGLASIAEIPLVCINVQRGGPSTGLPTKSEQADLFQAVFSAHGDSPRPVLAPTSVEDSFRVTVEAFNIAETYQTPVIVLSDQDIAQRKETVPAIDTHSIAVVTRRIPSPTELEQYDRYRFTESGVSPISHPGMAGGNYLASGIEHTAHGAPTASGEMHARMNEKRWKKLLPLKQRRDLFYAAGDDHGPLALISWGSVAGVAREALGQAEAAGLRVKLLVPLLLYPISEEIYREFFDSVQAGLVVEQSHQGQLYRLIRMFSDVPPGVQSMARSGANPILASEIVARLGQMAMELQRQKAPELQVEG